MQKLHSTKFQVKQWIGEADNMETKDCHFGTLLLYTLISSNTTLRYMFAQGILESHLELTSLRMGGRH
jgi:hypothetical protein